MKYSLRFILAFLSVYRLSILLKYEEGPDKSLSNLRSYLGRKAAVGNKIDRFLADVTDCVHCSGVWFSLLTAICVLLPNAVTDFLLLWFGIAGAQEFLINKSYLQEFDYALEDFD